VARGEEEMMKSRFILEITDVPGSPKPFSVFLTQDFHLDFLPTKGLKFHLVNVPGFMSPFASEVEKVEIYLNDVLNIRATVTFTSYRYRGDVDADWEVFERAFLCNGWRSLLG
jgi:hypothetical protein